MQQVTGEYADEPRVETRVRGEVHVDAVDVLVVVPATHRHT